MRIEVNETLARMLATENLHIRYSPKARTASFDVKHRLLTLPLYARLEEIVYLLLAGHEAFHALWTKVDRIAATKMIDRDPKNARRAAGYVNICEDVRIENLGREEYPGMSKVFREGYAILCASGFFGDLTKLNQKSLIDRVNIYFKAGAHVSVPFAEKERPYVQAVGNARTFEEMIAACRSLYEFARDTQNEQFPELDDQDENDDQDDQGDESGNQSKQSKSKKSRAKNPDDQNEPKESKKDKRKFKTEADEDESSTDDDISSDDHISSDEEDESDGDDGEESDDHIASDGDDGEESDDSGEPSDADVDGDEDGESDGVDTDTDDKSPAGKDSSKPRNQRSLDAQSQDEFDRHLQEHCEPEAEFNYVTLPTVNLKAAVVDYSSVMSELREACYSTEIDEKDPSVQKPKKSFAPRKAWFDNLQRKLEPDVMYMVQQFMMHRRADQYARTRTSSTGDLDMNKLWSHRINESIFASTEVLPNDKNHGLILVVDWSGSMKDPLLDVMVQLLSIMLFCRRAKIPFEVYIFITRSSKVGMSFISKMDSVPVDNTTRLYNIFSSRMPQAHFYQMCLMMFSCFQGGVFNPPLSYLNPDHYGTPLGEAMLIASSIVPEFQKKNRLQFVHTIFLTDGDGNSSMNSRADQLEDQVTRRTYSPEEGQGSIDVLHLLPRIVRDRTRAKMVGFYVGGATQRMLIDSQMTDKEARKILDKEGFFAVKGTHYDQFFVVNPKMVVPDKIDPAGIVAARMKSRVMLQRFIKMIA